jgi:SnoaL-like domain
LSSNPDVKSITQRFFAAYDAHDVDAMLALCADGAQGRYLPYGKNSVMPVRGGLEKIWRGFPKAVPDFGVEIIEMIPGEENTIVVQALLGGTMPADVAGLVRKGELDASPTLTSSATTEVEKSRAWIVIGTTPLSTP